MEDDIIEKDLMVAYYTVENSMEGPVEDLVIQYLAVEDSREE